MRSIGRLPGGGRRDATALSLGRASGDNRRMAERTNLSGLWLGSYSYPGGKGPTTPFMAKLLDAAGSLSGETVEPNTVGRSSETLDAFIVGRRDGSSVDFTKTYDGASDAAHAIDYVGRLSGDGNEIKGVWSMEDLDGTFEMYREAVWEQAQGKAAEVIEL
jgi:hypothetical protein